MLKMKYFKDRKLGSKTTSYGEACGFTEKMTNDDVLSDFVQGKTQARAIFVVTIS